MPEPPPATTPAEATPATDRHLAMASEILTKTKGNCKLFDKPQRRLRYLSVRIAGTHGPAENTRTLAASQPRAVRTVANALPPIALVTVPVGIDCVVRVCRRTPDTTKPHAADCCGGPRRAFSTCGAVLGNDYPGKRGQERVRPLSGNSILLQSACWPTSTLLFCVQKDAVHFPSPLALPEGGNKTLATHHSPIMFSVLQNRQCLVDWA